MPPVRSYRLPPPISRVPLASTTSSNRRSGLAPRRKTAAPVSTVTALPLRVSVSGLRRRRVRAGRAVGDQPVGGRAVGSHRGREADQQPLDGAVASFLPAFQRAVTSNSAGTGAAGGVDHGEAAGAEEVQAAGEGHAERTTSPAAGDARGVTDGEQELGRNA